MNYVKLVLSGTYRETGIQTKGIASAAGKEGFRFDLFFLKVENLVTKKNVKKVLVECRHDFSAGVFAGLEEICERFETLKAAGKEVYFYSAAYGLQQLVLASAASYRLIHPMGSVKFLGIAQSFSFMKNLMRKYGLEAEVFRRGSYKSAGDRFRTDRLEPPTREQYEFFQHTLMDSISSYLMKGFGKTEDDISYLLEGNILTAEAAEDSSWIDEVVTVGDFENRWKENGDKEFSFRKVPEKAGTGFSLKSRQLAVLVFEGAIVDGRSRRDPMMGQAVGAASFIPHIRKLRDDKKVKAVVFRINSGGGSAFASEEIAAELRLLAEKKPLIISMSEVAGSGGYWISCSGRKTLALPTTLTGSIGVISIYFAVYRLMARLGFSHDTIKIGEHADAASGYRALTEAERKLLDSEIGEMYRSFVKMVADFRKLSEDEVDGLARGRVWPGSAAVEHKLVDAAGGLAASLKEAAEAAGMKSPLIKFYPEVKHGLIERLIMNMSKEDEDAAEAVSGAAGAAEAALIISGWSRLLKGINSHTGPYALMEERLIDWI